MYLFKECLSRRALCSSMSARRAHLLQTEMGISSNTSRQDTAAAFSFSTVSKPVLYTWPKKNYINYINRLVNLSKRNMD